MSVRRVKYKLEGGSLRIGRPENPELVVVGGSRPYLWIGEASGLCFATRDLKDMKGLYNALKEVFKEADQ